MNYIHKIRPIIQVLSKNLNGFSKINGFILNNSNEQYFSFQQSLDDFLIKGKNTLEIYIRPADLENQNKASLSLSVNSIATSNKNSGKFHYCHHDSETELLKPDILPINPEQGKSIIKFNFKYDYQTKKESIDSNSCDKRFNIDLKKEELIKEYNTNGNYLFDYITIKKDSIDYYLIKIEFYLFEERPYTFIYTADDIPIYSPINSDYPDNTPHDSVLEGLFTESKKAYKILQSKDFDTWREYISSMTKLYHKNPLFENIPDAGQELESVINTHVKETHAELEDFPESNYGHISKVIFNNKLAVIQQIIQYNSNQYYFSLNVDIYYAYKNKRWIVSYIELN